MIDGCPISQSLLDTSAAAVLYECPASIFAGIRSIKLVNIDSATHTYNIYVTPSGGAAYHYCDKDASLLAGKSVQILDSAYELILAPGDQICGDADADDFIQVTIVPFQIR